MGTNCASFVADLFLFCYEMDFMMSSSDDKQANIIDIDLNSMLGGQPNHDWQLCFPL